MPCNLIIEQAMACWLTPGGYSPNDVTATVRDALARAYQANAGLSQFSLKVSREITGLPVDPAPQWSLMLTVSWAERGSSWTFSCAVSNGRTLVLPVQTPPRLTKAIYGSERVVHDVTARLQNYLIQQTSPANNFQMQVGSVAMLNALFGSVGTTTSTNPVDPDSGVTKSLYVEYSQIYAGQTQPGTICGVDFQNIDFA